MLSAARRELQSVTSELMAASVDVARAEQKLEAARDAIEQQRRTQAQREAAVEEVRQARAADENRRDDATLRILNANALLADYVNKMNR